MSKQPEALELADMLATGPEYAAACRTLASMELRSQHALIQQMVEALDHVGDWFSAAGFVEVPAAQQVAAALRAYKESQ